MATQKELREAYRAGLERMRHAYTYPSVELDAMARLAYPPRMVTRTCEVRCLENGYTYRLVAGELQRKGHGADWHKADAANAVAALFAHTTEVVEEED